jgi:superfamily II DNA helicase RecQ
VQDVKDRKYNIIIVSPEMCLEDDSFRPTLSDPTFNTHIIHVTIDEAHLIKLWGIEFRPAWGKIAAIRALLSSDHDKISWLAQSATMHQEICRSLCMHPEYAFHLNLGNNRPNISQIVLRTQRAEDFLERCVTLLKGLKPGPTGRLPRSLLFFET